MQVTFRPLPVWPHKATVARQYARFDTPYPRTLELLEREVRALGGRDVVMGVGLSERDIRLDGQPRANARRGACGRSCARLRLPDPRRVKPRLLDLFCGAGGAAMGYHRAGFEVVGVDIKPQPHYPFRFIQADVMDLMAWKAPLGFIPDAIHASPPCQPRLKGLRAVNASLGRLMKHADLVDQTRDLVKSTGIPYVIENAEGALRDAVVLCGTSFGLPLRRHRDIESSIGLLVPPCAHGSFRTPRYWTSWRPDGEVRRATTVQVYGNGGETHEWGPAMGIDWMTPDELAEAIPPAYTEWIGRQLMASIERAA